MKAMLYKNKSRNMYK